MAKPKVLRHKVPKGDIIGYKRAYDYDDCKVVITLWIPKHAHAIRGNDQRTGRKIRASEAVVIKIENVQKTGFMRYSTDGSVKKWAWTEIQDSSITTKKKKFMYKLGETVKPLGAFEKNVKMTCAEGIHFFLDKQEAMDY